MGKKRFFDDRLKYLSFIQNTSEKKANKIANDNLVKIKNTIGLI